MADPDRSDKCRKQKHDMVHVEIFVGGETGKAVIEFLAPIQAGTDKAPFLARLTRDIESASQMLIAEAGHAVSAESILLEDPVKDAPVRPSVSAKP